LEASQQAANIIMVMVIVITAGPLGWMHS
jgi:hypothetical protein